MNAVKWVLIDDTKGATTTDGSKLSAAVLANIAEAVTSQVNHEFAAEWGAQATIRVGKDAKDIQPGEWAYGFLPSLPDAQAPALTMISTAKASLFPSALSRPAAAFTARPA